jgi:hypothetical protein
MIELLFNNKKKQSTRIFVASIYAPQSGITMKDPQALSLSFTNHSLTSSDTQQARRNSLK